MPILNDNDEDTWIAKAGCTVILVALVIGSTLLGLTIWGIVELIQLIGRLG